MRTVTIAGAGFAGLTLAHFLVKEGFRCVIHEKQERAGGLIGTTFTDFGQAEWAANALLADVNVENLFHELGIEFADRSRAAKRRYIFWDEPKRWPLSWTSSWRALRQGIGLYIRGDQELLPDEGESVADWTVRVFDREFLERLITPALQGIYAGDVQRMSAWLLVRALSTPRAPKGALRGSVSPLGGMGELQSALAKTLLQSGSCEIHLKSTFQMPEYVTTPLVIATSAWAAADILSSSHPAISQTLKTCEPVPLVRATVFFPHAKGEIEGFGCLFPPTQKFASLGVLFDSSIFPSRSNVRSESWILGGARNPEVVAWSDQQVLETILNDRMRLSGRTVEPVGFHIQRWQRAIPHYTCEWELGLKSLHVAPPLYLHGNYLGQIGLSRILQRSMTLAREIKDNYGE